MSNFVLTTTILAGINVIWFAINISWAVTWAESTISLLTDGPIYTAIVYTVAESILIGIMIGSLITCAIMDDKAHKPLLSSSQKEDYGSCSV